jgi:hypothetical protein
MSEYNSPKSPPKNGPVAPVAPAAPVVPDTDPSSEIFHVLSIKSEKSCCEGITPCVKIDFNWVLVF